MKNTSKSSLPRQLRLRIICVRPPAPSPRETGFGLQDNSRGDWVLHPGQPQANGNLHFTCACAARPHPKTGAPNFLGDFVQGPPAKRFLYLSWKPKNWRPGEAEVAPPPCTRRMKIHLASITWEQIEAADSSGGVLEATVNGTAQDGGPAFGSVPLLGAGWKQRKN